MLSYIVSFLRSPNTYLSTSIHPAINFHSMVSSGSSPTASIIFLRKFPMFIILLYFNLHVTFGFFGFIPPPLMTLNTPFADSGYIKNVSIFTVKSRYIHFWIFSAVAGSAIATMIVWWLFTSVFMVLYAPTVKLLSSRTFFPICSFQCQMER